MAVSGVSQELKGLRAIFRREFVACFLSPVAAVFICAFLFATSLFTFYVGNFFGREQADLDSFLTFLPWLYLFLIPAVSMRLWAEDRRNGMLELLMTLPVTPAGAVIGKFLAAWGFVAVALALTFPLWLTVSWLGEPDHGAIAGGYAGAFMLAGSYLAIGACLSALASSQIAAFILTGITGFLFTVAGAPIVLEAAATFLPRPLLDTVASFSLLQRYENMSEGLIALHDVVYFLSLIAFWLFANVIAVTLGRR